MKKDTCTIIDITHIIEQRKIKDIIQKQLYDLGLAQYFVSDCSVEFVEGEARYSGMIVSRDTGRIVHLDENLDVAITLSELN
jgi:hypothetical protein|tara:strand:+ start:92 stop:337 length:246 start_codon:yes stop_codon:yes gene_type:complete